MPIRSWRRHRRFALAALGMVLALLATAQTPFYARSGASRDRALKRALDRLLAAPSGPSGFWGVYVYSLDRRRVLYDHNGGNWFTPASNAKLFTLAAALDRLGAGYRFHTALEAAAAPDAGGVVHGDLILVGVGDPSLSGRVYPYRSAPPPPPPGTPPAPPYDPWAAQRALARQAAARGVTRIEGDIVGDDTYFADDPYGAGWAADDLDQDYGAPVSALTINDNQRGLELLPGAAPGAPAEARWIPDVDPPPLENRVTTGVADTPVEVSTDPENGSLLLRGTLAADSSGAWVSVPIVDPALYAAQLLRQALIDQGIAVSGVARARHREVGAPDGGPPSGFELGGWDSPPLAQLLQTAAKVSQNLHTELMLRLLGKLQGPPDLQASGGEAAAGQQVVAEFLHDAGLGPIDAELADGSGLSRLDLVTPAGVVRLLNYMARRPEAAAWEAMLPVAGQDGTLARRFLNTAAAGDLRAKTGSLTHVACLSGYVTTRYGEHLSFAIMADNQGRPTQPELDRIALALLQ